MDDTQAVDTLAPAEPEAAPPPSDGPPAGDGKPRRVRRPRAVESLTAQAPGDGPLGLPRFACKLGDNPEHAVEAADEDEARAKYLALISVIATEHPVTIHPA